MSDTSIQITIHNDHIHVARPAIFVEPERGRDEQRYYPPTHRVADCSDSFLRGVASTLGLQPASDYDGALRLMADVLARTEGYLPTHDYPVHREMSADRIAASLSNAAITDARP